MLYPETDRKECMPLPALVLSQLVLSQPQFHIHRGLTVQGYRGAENQTRPVVDKSTRANRIYAYQAASLPHPGDGQLAHPHALDTKMHRGADSGDCFDGDAACIYKAA